MRNKYEERVARLQAKFADAGIDGLYINHEENVDIFKLDINIVFLGHDTKINHK